jgi:hypothetical protein
LKLKWPFHLKGRQNPDRLVVDTGAAHTLISADIVEKLGIYFENGDSLVSSYGIGGVEYSFRKLV